MEISRRDGLKAALAGAAALALGPKGARAAAAGASGGTLRCSMGGTPVFFDPHMLASYPTRDASYMVFDTLFSMDSKGNVRPQMVEKYDVSADSKTYRFKLRPKLGWHDGTPVTGKDCIASIRRWMRHDGIGQIIQANLADMKADGDDGFTISLKEPMGIVVETLGKGSSVVPFMLRASDAAKDDLGAAYRPIGSGPFTFNAGMYQPNNRIVFDRNPHYVPREEAPDFLAGGKKVYLDRVEWVVLPNPSSAIAAIQAGEIDYIQWIDYDSVGTLKADKNVHIVNVDPIGKQGYLRPNHAAGAFSNPKMLQALLYLVDQEAFLRAITGNKPEFYSVCPAYFMCGLPYASDVGAPKPDLAKAKALMKEAGYDGKPIRNFQITNIPAHNIAGLVTAQLLKKAGATVQSMPGDIATILQRRIDKNIWDLQWGYIESFDGGSPLSNPYFRANGAKAMPGWPDDPELERLRTAFAMEVDAKKRMGLAIKMQQRAYAVSVPYVPTGQYRLPSAVRTNVHDVIISGAPVFWSIKKTA
jgi:peptide/nickel transport system substrate-binding protein